MSKKALGVVIKLVSMANTGYFYTTMKNARLPKKLLLRKYDPVVRQHVLFKVRLYLAASRSLTQCAAPLALWGLSHACCRRRRSASGNGSILQARPSPPLPPRLTCNPPTATKAVLRTMAPRQSCSYVSSGLQIGSHDGELRDGAGGDDLRVVHEIRTARVRSDLTIDDCRIS